MDIMLENRVNFEDLEQMYSMNEIKVDKGFYTLYELKRRYDANDSRIVLDSDFQRESIWSNQRKAELIESILMGLPLPIFYFNQDKYGKLIVVDGRQRLTAIFEFMNDKFPLNKLKIMSNMNHLRFSELSPMMMSRIEDYQIQAHVILPPTPDRIKFDIFDRVNRGGMQLNKQEIRNALYQGNATVFLNEIVNSKAFREATGSAFVNEKRMKDKYLVNRFLAFFMMVVRSLLGDVGRDYRYSGDVDEALGLALDAINHMSEEQIVFLKTDMIHTLEKIYIGMGADAFRLETEGRRSPINMNVFETVMFAYMFSDVEDKKRLQEIGKGLRDFMNTQEFRNNIGNHRDSAPKLYWRIERAIELGKGNFI